MADTSREGGSVEGGAATASATSVTAAPPSRPEYDASLSGTGSQRVVGVAQLYVRLTNSYPMTITVVDALCLTFGASGATIPELASYLALSENAVRAALEDIPQDMRCTSADLEDATVKDDGGGKRQQPGRAAEDPYYDGSDEDGQGGASGSPGRGKGDAVRYFLNYKRLLSVAYAHVSHILLALCVSPLPASPYTERIKRAQMEAVVRTTPVSTTPTGREDDTVEGLLMTTLNVSPTLRKKEAVEGIYCSGCQFYFALQDFDRTTARCPTCQQDVLRALVMAIRARLDTAYTRDHRSLIVVPSAAAAPRDSKQPHQVPTTGADCGNHEGPRTANTSAGDKPTHPRTEAPARGIDCPLARDPFLVQQALAFLFLYSTPFACLNDASYVVDPDEILTEPEYQNRLRGKASVADEFRALHRNANKVRVKLVSQRQVDAALREENARKIAKRANLPPWLQHSTTLASLTKADGVGGPQQSLPTASPATGGDEKRLTDATAADMGRAAAPQQSVERKRPRGVDKSASAATPANAKARLLSQAHFVVTEFLDDDFDAVALPRYAARLS